MHLERYLQRLSEIQEELGEIGTQLQTSAEQSDTPGQNLPEVRIAGFSAYHLAQEGVALLNLVAVTLSVVRTTATQDGDQDQLQKLDTVNHYLDELEPILKRILTDMAPYRSLDPVSA